MQVWAWTLTGLYLFITTIIWVEESDVIWDYSYSREDNYEDFKDFRNRSIETVIKNIFMQITNNLVERI